ncbi:MarR family winged helix-turn-helix transcriptional regulator [Arthrobacter zhaoguopingii]|uniref:MarR family winged helix-turn-helix transcriptional regulator n=1 Tax=Arthrobacter zhaoguopingii TaxID=2681491 RepID=UPI001FE3FDBD|nr:MarR family winged helix-turn-helix transcriptional regulator [Arthrobacter zhaoguopingii]
MGEGPELPPVRLTAEAWESLFRAQVAVMKVLRQDEAFKQLGIRDYDVLFNLSRCPTGWARLNELNANLLISQPSLSRMVERLEAKGLIQRRQAKNDQRGVELSLTEEGRALQKRIGTSHVRVIQETLGPVLSVEELEQLRLLTTKISAGVERPS